MADGSSYDMPEPVSGEGATFVRTRTIRVKIGSAPLIIRAKQDTNSLQLGTVPPGQMVTVLKEVISHSKVRAMIALDSISSTPEAAQIIVPRGATSRSVDGAANQLGRISMAPASAPAAAGAPAAAASSDSAVDDRSASVPSASTKLQGVIDDDNGFGNVGWVTLLKDGKKLVTSRVRQSAGSRQQHERQWTRRLANDKAAKVKVGTKAASHGVSLELASDPTGIGFAFGGVYPGTLHSRGHLHESHNVSYSIGLVGEYLLHVRLRQQVREALSKHSHYVPHTFPMC